jgi:hypothetical protein
MQGRIRYPEGCDQPLARKVLLSWTRFRVRLPGPAKLLDLFKNLAVLSQVSLNLPHMAANSLFPGKLF